MEGWIASAQDTIRNGDYLPGALLPRADHKAVDITAFGSFSPSGTVRMRLLAVATKVVGFHSFS